MQVQKSTHSTRMAAWLLALLVCLSVAAIGYALLSGGIWPEAPGINVASKDELTVDYSNAADGYVMARGANTNNRLKLRVSKDGMQLTYDLNQDGEYESLPLQLGSGEYKFEMFKNVSGTKYAQAGSVAVTAELEDDNLAFLSPSQYVYYTEDSEAVQISDELLSGLETDAEKLAAVRQYVIDNFTYDFKKAANITSGTLPDIDYLLENRMGICQDLSAFVACMLRVQGIPTQLVIGYADKYYHAWTNVLIDGEYQLFDPTALLGGIPENATYTVERFY